jgi:hypothetical protein
MSNVYDSHAGDHEANVKSAINDGQNLLNHADHANQDSIGLGHVNHGTHLNKAEADAFSNGDKQGIMYSIGCWANAYDFDDCIAEHLVQNPNGGCVAFVGNSRFGWYNPGMTNTLSMLYDINFFRSLFEQGHHILGECFSDHKNDSPTTDEVEKYIFAELTLLGDPELPIWTENPSIFSVSHPMTLPTGPSSFTVHVEDDGGGNINQACVCLWKGAEVYLIDYTNSAGDVTFSPSPGTMGTMYVTATKHNYIPYEGQAQVTAGEPPPAVTDLTIGLSAGDLLLAWSTPAGESVARYVIYRNTHYDFVPASEDSIAGTDATTYTDVGASGSASINYYYAVKAVNASGQKSDPSNTVGEYDIDLIGARSK